MDNSSVGQIKEKYGRNLKPKKRTEFMAESTLKSTMKVGGIEARDLSQNSYRC